MENDSPLFHFTLNKNGKILDVIDYKKVIPKGPIGKCEGTLVQFADGTSDHFDAVIMCTGYNLHYFPFLPEKYKNKTFRNHYKFIFDVEDPSIAFLGYVRPVIGAIPSITEVQSRAEVIMLIILCIILFRISCNFSALCSKLSALFSRLFPRSLSKQSSNS